MRVSRMRPYGCSLVAFIALQAPVLAQAVDTLESIGPDGTVITTRVLDGVTVTYAASGVNPITAQLYGSAKICHRAVWRTKSTVAKPL